MSNDHAETEKTIRLFIGGAMGIVIMLILASTYVGHERRTNARDLTLECVRHHTPEQCEKLVEALP